MKTHTPIRKLACRAVSLCLVLALLAALSLSAFAAPTAQSVKSDYLQRAMEQLRENAQVKLDADKDPNEVVRALVVTDIPAAVEKTGTVTYTYAAQTAEAQTLRSQESLIRRVERITGNKVINQAGYLVSAFSIEMTRAQMDQVAKLDGVVSVSEVTTFTSRMTTAKDMTSAMELWEEENGGYTGEGIVVAVIDSGINYTHPDMQMREGAKLKFTQADMEQKIAELGYGEYYTDKVPFGHSYCSDASIENSSLTHGLHVSGIVAANGDEQNGGIKGVAPDAQIFAMKVFNTSGQGFNDDIICAVEDSVKLGADILNLSLGSTAGFYDDVEYLQKALGTAQENGVLACVAAGNDGTSASNMGENTNDWGVIDTGAVSSPSVYPGALSVASVDNAFLSTPAINIFSGEELIYSGAVTDFSEGKKTDWTSLGEVQIIDLGYGDMFNDIFPKFATLPSEPYVALIQRGNGISFESKISNATGLGHAAAVIIYNNEATDEVPRSLSAENAKNNTAVIVSGNTGAKLKQIADEGGKISFNGLYDTIIANEATGGRMSTFSSWGPTPTLDIKPEISAPGGNIKSLSTGTDYEVMSGTSMATPYVAGSSALVLEALQAAIAEGSLNLNGEKINDFLKNDLMNTADPIYDDECFFSVRQQGSGMVDPLDAANNHVIATYNGRASIALKEVGETTEFTVTLTNYGTEAQTYMLPAYEPVYTDYTDPDTGDYSVVVLKEAKVTYNVSSVTVPAGGSATITGSLSIPRSAEKNHYVEAFVRLDGAIDLSLPLLGFYGDWYGCERIVDLPAWDENNILTNFYEKLPATTVAVGGSYGGLDTNDFSTDPDHIAFSPNGDKEFETTQPLLGLLRSSEEIYVDVLDENGDLVRCINHVDQAAKFLAVDAYESRSAMNILSGGSIGDGTWDGTRYDTATGKDVLCEEGQYYLNVRARMPGSDTFEETKLPVKLDLTAPEVHIISATPVDGTIVLTYKATDFSGIMNYGIVYVNGDEGYEFTPSEEAEYDEATGIYTLVVPASSYVADEMNEIVLAVTDYAMNVNVDIIYTDVPADVPVYFSNINNDDTLTVLQDVSFEADSGFDNFGPRYYNFRNCAAEIRGIVSSEVAKLTINGNEAVFDSRNGFAVTVSVEKPGPVTLTVSALNAGGEEIFHAEKSAIFDVQDPELMAYLADENGEWDKSMLYTTTYTYDGYIFGTRYTKDQMIPVGIDVQDETLTEVTVEWIVGTMSSSDFMSWIFGEPISAEVHKSTYTAADLDENGRLYLDVPFAYKESIYVDDDGTVYDMSASTQIVKVTAYDAAGNETIFDAIFYDDAYSKENYGDQEYEDVRENDGMTKGGYTALEPFWKEEDPGYDTYILDPAWVKDGMMHVVATLARDSNYAEVNGVEYWPEEGSRTLEFDIPIKEGLNITYFKTYADFGMPNGLQSIYKIYLYYLPDTVPTVLTFDDERIEDGAVITTNQETFPITGSMITRYGNVSMKINGDQIFYPEGAINVEGDYMTRSFSYGARLTEGENIVTVTLSDATNYSMEMHFTVILDTTAPDAPAISQDETGAVTIEAPEEGAALYYSYDGEEWILYTGPFAPGGETVYAKAVDEAGNESAVSKLVLEVEAPEAPVISVNKDKVTITAGEGLTIYYSFDGETWTAYTGSVTMKQSGKIYAKAVDANGIESAVVYQFVAIGGVKTGDSVLPAAMLLLTVSAMGLAAVLLLRRKLVK